jgi:hypothetical protein
MSVLTRLKVEIARISGMFVLNHIVMTIA